MILSAKLVSRSGTDIWQKVIDPEELTRVRNHFTYTGESRQPELLWQHQAILKLGGEHVSIDILSSCISAEKKFPDEFYENIYKLKGWAWPGLQKNRYSVVAHYTTDLIYRRLAPGLLEELERKSPRTESGHRPNKLHQWLTDDIGNPMLAQHMHSIIMFQRLALASGFGWLRFVNMVDQVMPKRGNTLELPFPDGSVSMPELED